MYSKLCEWFHRGTQGSDKEVIGGGPAEKDFN